MEAKIKARFGDWQGKGPAGADPDLGAGQRARRPTSAWRSSPARPTTVELAWVTPPDLSPDNAGQAPARDRRAPRPGGAEPPPRHPGARGQPAVHRRRRLPRRPAAPAERDRRAGLPPSPTTGSRRWPPPRPRRAAPSQFGVRPDELAREIAESEASLKLAADGAATRRTPALADEIVGHAGRRRRRDQPGRRPGPVRGRRPRA